VHLYIEHLALCIRYVGTNCNIQEKFMEFIKLPRIRATDIAVAIMNAIEDLDLSLVVKAMIEPQI